MKHITIKPSDLERRHITFSPSNSVIDELAYSAGEYTSDDLGWEGEPMTPYMFDYEADLLEATKTEDTLYDLARRLEVSLNANIGRLSIEAGLRAGAFMALELPEAWEELLTAYKEKLDNERMDGISPHYNEALQKEVDDYCDRQYKEWLNGDYGNWFGVIYLIGKYFTDNPRACSYDDKRDVYTFAIDEERATSELAEWDGSKFTLARYKDYLLDRVYDRSCARREKDARDREERKKERERVSAYKSERKAEEVEARRKKLSAMKIK